jgi:hypothetical protein
MKRNFKTCLAGGFMVVFGQQVSAVNIEFDYVFDANNFFNTQAKKDVLNAAGSFFSGIIQDDLTAINSAGSNVFDARFSNPASGALTTINNFSVDADTLIVYAGGRTLSGSTLGMGGPGSFSAGGTSTFVDNAVTRGETPTTSGVQGSSATDFAPWGGSITFNTGASWYFDPDASTNGDLINNDFFSAALHELGHLLGIGTADSWDNLVSGSHFTGTASSGVFTGDVPLETNLAHWEDGTMGLVNGVSQDAAMDPSILVGTRKVFTDLDLAALTDIGWEVAAVPVPAAIWLFGSGLIGLVVTARRRS